MTASKSFLKLFYLPLLSLSSTSRASCFCFSWSSLGSKGKNRDQGCQNTELCLTILCGSISHPSCSCFVHSSVGITAPCTIPYFQHLHFCPIQLGNLTCVFPLGFQESAHLESKDPVGTNANGSVHNILTHWIMSNSQFLVPLLQGIPDQWFWPASDNNHSGLCIWLWQQFQTNCSPGTGPKDPPHKDSGVPLINIWSFLDLVLLKWILVTLLVKSGQED